MAGSHENADDSADDDANDVFFDGIVDVIDPDVAARGHANGMLQGLQGRVRDAAVFFCRARSWVELADHRLDRTFEGTG